VPTVADVEKRGRPTLFTPELGREICTRVELVGFEAVAAERVGVHRETVARWRVAGEAGEEPFVEFARALATAKATYMERELGRVDDAKWKLERLDRRLFGNNQRVEHTGKDGKPIEQRHSHALTRDQSVSIVSNVLGVAKHLVEKKFGKAEADNDNALESGDGDE
jgi:hypothetical protein